VSSSSTADSRYSPVDWPSDLSQQVSELLVAVVAAAGFGLAGGLVGVVAGGILFVCWLFLQTEITFVVGAVLVAVLGGDPSTPGTVLVTTGLTGLLALDLARTSTAPQPVAVFLASVVVGVVAVVGAVEFVALHWVVGVATVGLIGALYGLYRLERRVADRWGSDGEASAETAQIEQEGANT